MRITKADLRRMRVMGFKRYPRQGERWPTAWETEPRQPGDWHMRIYINTDFQDSPWLTVQRVRGYVALTVEFASFAELLDSARAVATAASHLAEGLEDEAHERLAS